MKFEYTLKTEKAMRKIESTTGTLFSTVQQLRDKSRERKYHNESDIDRIAKKAQAILDAINAFGELSKQ